MSHQETSQPETQSPDPEVVVTATKRQFSKSYKLRILEQADRCTQPGEIGALLRREGLYSSHLTRWRKWRSQLKKEQTSAPETLSNEGKLLALWLESEQLRARLGLALLPATAQRRIVLLSDGIGNVPGAEMAVQLAAASGVELSVLPLPVREAQAEAWIDGVDVPATLYEGEQFGVTVRVCSTPTRRPLLAWYSSLIGDG